MRRPETRVYRVAVAVAFGLIGFGVNFLDIEFMEGATFKISILAGLFFPLVVALAWGWRYGLLSALAGGCQTMWWLWNGDGWGVLYSAPVFTLWIVWHGWCADRRSDNHPWYVSSFAVEVPFRIVIELGFLVVFRWLVSLNPPPWNPAISWDHVSAAWLQTVAIKHIVTAYVLLTAAYVALSLGAVRRFFGLPPRPAQRETTAIYAGAVLFGLLLWALDALVHYFAFPREGQTFWSIAVHGANAHEVFMRSVYMATAVLAGIALARLNRRRAELRELLDHRNRVLAAIRNVNQLIVREKNPLLLLDEACRLLVETHGYYNAWIVLMADGRPGEPFFHAGFNGGFAPMAERLRAGDLPTCAQAALSSDGVQVKEDPPSQCVACPLASSNTGRAGMSLRLEHAGRVFGWMCMSCPGKFARSAEEHDLLTEAAGDIAFALWAIEAETQRETLAGKYAAVLNSTSDAVLACDLDGGITVFSPGSEKLFGCSADEVMGSPIVRFCPEDRLEEQAEMMRHVRETGAIRGFETERLTADGQRVPVEITLSLNTDAHGRPQGINGIFRDITERKQAQKVLESSYALLRIAGETARFGGWDVDLEKYISHWSDTVADIHEMPHGYAPPVEEGISFYAPEWRDKITEVFTACAEKGIPYDEEMEIITKKGKRVWVRTIGQAVKDEKGAIIKVQGSFQDITEQKRVRSALGESESRYRRLFESAKDGILILDAETGKVVDVNPYLLQLLGYDRESFMGKHLWDIGPFHDIAASRDLFRVLQEGEYVRYEHLPLETSNGGLADVEFVSNVYLVNNLKVIQCNIRDITERKRSEAALRESEKKYSTLVEGSLQGVVIAQDGPVRLCFANAAMENFTGYGVDELLSMGASDLAGLIHPDDREQFFGNFKRRLAGEQVPPVAQYRLVRKDGEMTWAMCYSSGIDYLGEAATLTTFIDVTERVASEKALAEQQALLTAIYLNAPLVLMVVDGDRHIRQVNGFAEQFAGRPVEEMMGLRGGEALRCLHALDDPEGCGFGEYCRRCIIRNTVLDTLETGEKHLQVESPYYFQSADGEVQETTLLCSTTPLNMGGQSMVLVTLQDITDRKRSEEQVLESRKRYKLLADNTLDVIWTMTMDVRFTYINPAIETMFGFTPDEWVGTGLWEHCDEHHFAGMKAVIEKEAAKGPNQPGVIFETQMLRRDGSAIAVEIHGRVIFDSRSVPISLQGVTRDITDRKKAEAEREKLQEQFIQAQKMETVGRLAGGVAHDFNNILTAITGFSELVHDSLGEDDPVRNDVKEIQKAADSAAALTNQLLAFSRKQIVSPKVLDINQTLIQSEKMLKRIIGEDIDLIFIPGQNLGRVLIDPSQVDQILMNLAVNSRDAMPGGGKLTVETARLSLDEKKCQSCGEPIKGEYVMLAVSDNGPGMDAETVNKIFEPFFTTKEKGKGTGLGLATVHGIVHQNNGHIHVYSEPGVGATFKIYLPVAQHDTVEKMDEDESAVTQGVETILVVEDQEIVRKLAVRILTAQGYKVLSAENGMDAVSQCEECGEKIDLILTDVVMPQMSGKELQAILLEKFPHLKTLFMSGYTENTIAHHGVLDKGINFIQKPFRPQDLARKVRQVLDSSDHS